MASNLEVEGMKALKLFIRDTDFGWLSVCPEENISCSKKMPAFGKLSNIV